MIIFCKEIITGYIEELLLLSFGIERQSCEKQNSDVKFRYTEGPVQKERKKFRNKESTFNIGQFGSKESTAIGAVQKEGQFRNKVHQSV